MPRKRRRTPPARLFYAPPPSWRAQWPVAVFAALSLALCYTTLVRSQGGAALVGSLAMLVAATWVNWRRRWPWLGPALHADAGGLIVNPESERPAALAWHDVVGILDDPSDDSLVFDPLDPNDRVQHLLVIRRGPAVPRNVRTRDGIYFIDVIEDYWDMPKDVRPRG